MKFLPVVLVVALSGCSGYLGERFHDRADDYLITKDIEPTLDVGGAPVGGQDLYPIPQLPTTPAVPTAFEVPKPDPLVGGNDVEEDSQSLTAYQSQALNPRLETDGSGSLVLRMDGNFAQAWSAVSDALTKTPLKVTDLNRSVGTWYMELSERESEEDIGWWGRLWGSKPELVTGTYLLKMNRSRTGVYVSLLKEDDKLAGAELTESVLRVLNKQLTQ
ncbi:outer membrane protein assembly factor BamC [Parathalassolituus penaei]|uniref:Outer membrane protein assembly factor BamC n=1 Tax=Parathalassolituus penaei TaxID=2997323 RepID=A0A9X3IQB6_9GAMM|nr:outer membrane protein assembly factor BamC [Parathalassolituus penaei]MCY0963621.1 outer membrane protein assembly factor BamC [Parathalassolituus penaei]